MLPKQIILAAHRNTIFNKINNFSWRNFFLYFKLILIVYMIERERERRGVVDTNYHNLVYSKYSLCLYLYTKKSISKFKSHFFALIKNTKNNPSQKMLRFFIAYKIFSNPMFIHNSISFQYSNSKL